MSHAGIWGKYISETSRCKYLKVNLLDVFQEIAKKLVWLEQGEQGEGLAEVTDYQIIRLCKVV